MDAYSNNMSDQEGVKPEPRKGSAVIDMGASAFWNVEKCDVSHYVDYWMNQTTSSGTEMIGELHMILWNKCSHQINFCSITTYSGRNSNRHKHSRTRLMQEKNVIEQERVELRAKGFEVLIDRVRYEQVYNTCLAFQMWLFTRAIVH